MCEPLRLSAYFRVQAAREHVASEQLRLNEELVMCSATESSDRAEQYLSPAESIKMLGRSAGNRSLFNFVPHQVIT